MTNSFITPGGNTVYYGGRKAAGEHRAGAIGGYAVDRGSDGTIDKARVGAIGVGPRGVAGGVAGFGPNGAGAAGFATNGETLKTWKRFVHA
ncbi:MAG: hypothetical protein HY319_03935 [Armatimonadetes bacterium]|nr:hypothetical protein [Armatimonadota bacterium]